MDYQLAVLVGLIGTAVALGVGLNSRRPDERRKYQRVFSVAAGGLLLLIAGLAGWDLSDSRGWFQGARWVDGPVWWQVGTGTALLFLARVMARRVRPGEVPR
jgi:H+/Cl- antiporter ClcA